MITTQAAMTGILIGGMYAMMAAGLSVTWGMLRVINLAHFGMILVSAYLTFELATSWQIDPLLTLLITVPIMFVAGAALQWAFDRLAIAEFNSLLVSFGLLIIAIQLVSNVWSADFRRMSDAVNPYATRSLSLGRFVFPISTLIAFGVAVLVVVAVQVALQRTFLGRAVRAFAQDPAIASAFGIDHRRLGMLVAGGAGASAAVAGALFALANSITPSTAYDWFGVVFAVVILGGVGQLVSALVAGVLIGVVSGVVSVTWSPADAPLVVFCAIVVALVARPRGLFSGAAE
ncbi:MAG TPA: branched-chain amino acid ABC transporter permease [Mycobacterium sp.]|nr:branched-chain amino acid ABC transporter permease [Mycobacterium sp.]